MRKPFKIALRMFRSKWRPYLKKKYKYSVNVELENIKSQCLCSEESLLFNGIFCYTLQKT